MQPLLLLKQTLEVSADPGALQLDGQNVRFTLAEQLFSHRLGQECSNEFSIKIHLADGQSLKIVFQRLRVKGIDVTKMIYEKGAKSSPVTITPDMKHDDVLGVLPKHYLAFFKEFAKRNRDKYIWTVKRERFLLTFDLHSEGEPKKKINFIPFGISPGMEFVPFIKGIIHLPGLRGNPLRTYPKTSCGPDFPGTFEQYVASVISRWHSADSTKLDLLGKTLEELGLTWKIEPRRVDDTQVEIKVGRLPHSVKHGARDLVSIADVGFGVSQTLPVVVALLAARPGQLVYLEQPEIHLHPLAQRALAGVLLSAVKRGVVSVVETHSALLLREVQTLIATGKLRKEDVALHWLQRDKEGGTIIKTAELDNNGAYGDWPADFDRTELLAERDYLDAVEKKEEF